jgi:hypothetical protein
MEHTISSKITEKTPEQNFEGGTLIMSGIRMSFTKCHIHLHRE